MEAANEEFASGIYEHLALTHINQAFYSETIEGYQLELLPLITPRPKEDIKLRIYHRRGWAMIL